MNFGSNEFLTNTYLFMIHLLYEISVYDNCLWYTVILICSIWTNYREFQFQNLKNYSSLQQYICFNLVKLEKSIKGQKIPLYISTLNPFVPNAPFLHPLKTSEILTVFWCFQEVEKGSIWNEWVKDKS